VLDRAPASEPLILWGVASCPFVAGSRDLVTGIDAIARDLHAPSFGPGALTQLFDHVVQVADLNTSILRDIALL
jgi:hypothetical protein